MSHRRFSIVMSMALLLPVSASAAPAITCHCFTDRSYDPAKPALADPYFLATTQNSFFAAIFTADKKRIVMKKQTGSSADDLWVAYWIASKTGTTGEELLEWVVQKGGWKEVVLPLRARSKSLGERFTAEAVAGAAVDRLARIIVDGIIVQHRLLGERDLEVLRREWATNQEVIIAALLAQKTGRPALQLYREVKSGAKSWGGLLSDEKLRPAALQGEFAALLK